MLSSAQSKIIQQELVDICLNPIENITAGPKGGIATITGPSMTPYSGGVFFLDISFPENYPQKPPILVFRTRIYHCNINSCGDIALDVIDNHWSPTIGLRNVLLCVTSLLIKANHDQYLVPTIAQQYISDRGEHDRIAEEWTKRYAA